MRKFHTPGKSKARDQERANMRSKVLAEVVRVQETSRCAAYTGYIADKLGETPQRVVCALNELLKSGEVQRVERGLYTPATAD